MKETDIISVYDTVRIERDSRKARFTSIVKASVFTFLSVAFAIAIVFYGDVLPVFFACLICLVTFVILAVRAFGVIRLFPTNNVVGDIVRIHKEVKGIKNHPVATFNLFRRKYDSYWTDEVRLTLNIESEGEIYTAQLNGITEKQSDYYRENDRVMHITATRFPIKAPDDTKSCICPICGKINSLNDKACKLCGKTIFL